MSIHDVDSDWISLKQAFTYAKRLLKHEGWAKLVLRDALADGSIPARAEAVLQEYALGDTRTLAKRRKREEIALTERTVFAALIIEPKYLAREPKGARLIINWSASRIAWVEPPPTKTFYHKATNRRGVVMGTRFVMYDVGLERSAVEMTAKHRARNHKIADTLSAKPTRIYLDSGKYRELLPTLFSLAEQGELDATYGPFGQYGLKAKFKQTILILSNNVLGKTTLQTCLAKLIEIDESARSRKIDQELTNTS